MNQQTEEQRRLALMDESPLTPDQFLEMSFLIDKFCKQTGIAIEDLHKCFVINENESGRHHVIDFMSLSNLLKI